MSVTFCVLKFFRSREVSATQLKNMLLMFVTFCVSKFFRSIDVSAVQMANKLPI